MPVILSISGAGGALRASAGGASAGNERSTFYQIGERGPSSAIRPALRKDCAIIPADVAQGLRNHFSAESTRWPILDA
jgi:hypothetical protein